MWASDKLTCLAFDIVTLRRLFLGLIQGISSLFCGLFVILIVYSSKHCSTSSLNLCMGVVASLYQGQ